MMQIQQLTAPPELIQRINSWVDNMSHDEWNTVSSRGNNPIPDLLHRGFETLFFPHHTCTQLGISEFILSTTNNVVIPPATFSNDYADVWVNRYYYGDTTPPHSHAYDYSGVIMLMIPDDSPSLEFFYPNPGDDTYYPPQFVGNTLVFPASLGHQVYTQYTHNERRTLSFNLMIAE